jgi:hypothetical protein
MPQPDVTFGLPVTRPQPYYLGTMDRELAYWERQLRDTLAGLEMEPGLSYEVQRTDEELVLKLESCPKR